MRRSIIDINRNNAFAFGVWKNGQRVLDLSTVLRVKFSFAGILIDSNANPNNFAWKDPAQLDESGKQVIVCQFGNLDLPTGKHGATITVHDTENTSGVVISRSYPIEVINHGGGIPPGVLEEVTLDDIPDGLSYSKVLASSILNGRVLVSGLEGTIDELEDGTVYQRTKAVALTIDGLIFLDSIDDTLSFKKTNASALDASGLVIWEEIIETTPGLKPDDSATVGALAGINLRDSIGNLLGDLDIITSQGIAASIAGQGLLATLNAVNLDDHVVDGVVYARIKSAALTVDGLVQLDATVDGTYSKVLASALGPTGLVLLDQVVDGTYQRVLSSALDASGLVLLDEVQIGTTYDLLAKTYITAGKIEVTGASPFTASVPVTMTDADVTQTIIDGGVITTGGIALSTAGYLRAGKISFADTTSGWWLGDDAGTPKLNIGSATKSMKWDGTDLSVTGRIISETNLFGGVPGRFGTSTEAYHISVGWKLTAAGLLATDPTSDPATNYTEDGQIHLYTWETTTWREQLSQGAGFDGGGYWSIYSNPLVGNGLKAELPVTNGGTAIEGEVSHATGVAGRFYSLVGTSIISTGGSRPLYLVPLSGANGHMELYPEFGAGAPTHVAGLGTIYMDGNGQMYINEDGTAGGWELIGGQV